MVTPRGFCDKIMQYYKSKTSRETRLTMNVWHKGSVMMRRCRLTAVVCLVFAAGLALVVHGNNLHLTNAKVIPYRPHQGLAYIRFDISWDNSWRYTNLNHDAVWVFFKAQEEGGSDWTNHVKLTGTGSIGTNTTGYSAGAGTVVDLITPDDGMGVFIRRSAQGSGIVSVRNARVVWNFAANELTSLSKVKIQAMAVEMVCVSAGSFYVGSGGTETGAFYQYPDTTAPFPITNEAYAIAVTNIPGNLWYAAGWDQVGPVPSVFPKGYAPFYCMKYEITEGQYTDFLNLLTSAQAANRFDTIRSPMTGAWPDFISSAPDRACKTLSWDDGIAYMDWAGLRPLSEFEFEKACRGPLPPVPDEYAWGNTNVVNQTGHVGTSGSGTETASPTNANCNMSTAIKYPVRVGIYATANSSREAAGASYWGIMELSGNLWERSVTVGNVTGRAFTGLMGDGKLDANGDANVSNWPRAHTGGVGGAMRGGAWMWSGGSFDARVSSRNLIGGGTRYLSTYNDLCVGWRGGRTAPAGVDYDTCIGEPVTQWVGGPYDGWGRDETIGYSKLLTEGTIYFSK